MENITMTKRNGAAISMPKGVCLPTLTGVQGSFDATGVFANGHDVVVRERALGDSAFVSYPSIGAHRSITSRPPL